MFLVTSSIRVSSLYCVYVEVSIYMQNLPKVSKVSGCKLIPAVFGSPYYVTVPICGCVSSAFLTCFLHIVTLSFLI